MDEEFYRLYSVIGLPQADRFGQQFISSMTFTTWLPTVSTLKKADDPWLRGNFQKNSPSVC
jgi:hypothetical protein